jgi:hypothetical protein
MPLRPPAGFISAFFDPLKNPNAPTIGTATGGDASASVTFTAPSNVGGSAISSYTAISTPDGVTASAASSPISVTGLTNGTAYTFAVWATNTYGPSAFSAASGSVTPQAIRGLFAGGYDQTGNVNVNIIDYVSISTTGNATDFGDLNQTTAYLAALGSSTTGVFGGGNTSTSLGSRTPTISSVTFSTTGNSTQFGDLTLGRTMLSACNSSTRGIFAGGVRDGTEQNIIDYVTFASLSNATDFGDLTQARKGASGCSSSTRGVFSGGAVGNTGYNTIDYITIASTGNATDFGDLSAANQFTGSCSSSTRGVIGGGYTTAQTNVIQYLTIASTGNTTSFGQLTLARNALAACSSSTRGIFAAGYTAASNDSNVLDYVTIASVGNATDFGDLTLARQAISACSNGNGGLQ